MSISIDPINAGVGSQPLQNSRKVMQPEAGASAPGGAPNARAVDVPGRALATPAAKTAADLQDGEAAKLSAAQTAQSLQEINKVLASMSISVQFQIDPDYRDVIVKVVDQGSGKVIRQIPTEEVVHIAKAMDNLKGLLFAQTT